MIKSIICKTCSKELGNYDDESGIIATHDFKTERTPREYPVFSENFIIHCSCGSKYEMIQRIGVD